MYLLLIFVMTTLMSYAQHSEQPQKENTEDLRATVILFKIEDLSSGKTYQLERTFQLDHYLRLRFDDEILTKKTDSRDARKLDADFAARFIKVQYEIPAREGDCRVSYKLSMKGESQEVCKKDEKKGQEIASFVEGLQKRF